MSQRKRLIEPTSLATKEDIGWLAGFFEGEGCVSELHKESGTYYKLSFSQKNPEPLVKAHALCGGTASAPPSQSCLTLEVCGAKARRVARLIYPLLSTRRKRQMDPLLAWTGKYVEKQTPDLLWDSEPVIA